MNTFDRTNARSITNEMLEALKGVATKHGIQFSVKGGNFSGSSLTCKIEAAIIGASGVAETRERKDFVTFAESYGLKAEWLDKTFVHGTDTFTIVGLSTRKSKNPVLCKNSSNGKTYVFQTHSVKMHMATQPAIA